MVNDMTDYGSGTINITYDPSVVHVTDVTSSSDSTVTFNNNNVAGFTKISASNTDGASGDIVFANVEFTAVGISGASTPLNLDVVTLYDRSFNAIPTIVNNGSFTVDTTPPPSPCYIATATYGTPLDSRIDVLRDFRDELLLTNPIGKTFVSTYYRTSPPIADALRKNGGLGTVTRLTLITPLVYLSKSVLSNMLVVFVLLTGLIAFFLFRTDRAKILRPLLVGTSSILVFTAAIFSLGFIGYAIPFCATIGAYMLPSVIPLSVIFTVYTILKMHVPVSDNIRKHAWNSKR